MIIIEVTGTPAAGKSWFIDQRLATTGKGACALDATQLRDQGGQLNHRLVGELAMWVLLVTSTRPSIGELRWIFQQVRAVQRPWLQHLNLARNCLLKLAYRPYLERRTDLVGCEVYIDEGLSHLPVLLQDGGRPQDIVEGFTAVFGERLRNTQVICLETEPDETTARLIRRGHTRIDTSNFNAVQQLVVRSGESVTCLVAQVSPPWRLSCFSGTATQDATTY